ncbi:MAG: alkaline phosphatase family protein, partial [Bacteroidota bacterium]|nr:alkaline phosphatase family protein [Bacteroidota bacterium]
FKRLLNEGFSCENTFINYLPSYTAPGHTTIFTGSVPAIDGIAGNDWIDQNTGRHWYCTEDTSVQSVGTTSAEGQMSPKNLLVSTVTDELRLATNFQSKVIGVSLKDRASILPAGHTANGAFWFDDASGNFITSTYYMKELPGWLKDFNNKKVPEQLVANDWSTFYPANTYKQSTQDDEPWEGIFSGEKTSVFPHHLAGLYKQNNGFIRSSPFGNSLTLELAKAALDGNKMGQGTVTDFLTINCASTDYVGHMFGPNSIETEDTYLRLDKDLASFFKYLDDKVGKGNYIVFLTADHGVAHSINFMKEHLLPADFFNSAALLNKLNTALAQKFGLNGLVTSGINYQVNFDLHKIDSSRINFDAVKKVTVDFLQKQPGVEFAVDIENIGAAPIPTQIKTMIINGYYSKRCGPVMIIPEPGWFEGFEKGTTHGTWNPYDAHIPLIFMGWGVQHGETNREINMTDIAPTIAALLHIQMPNGSIGKVISEIKK